MLCFRHICDSMVPCSERDAMTGNGGIDKLTCSRGLAVPERGVNALNVDARTHSAGVLKSKDA